MTRTGVKYGVALTAAALGATVFGIAPASASDSVTWSRNCSDDRTYVGYVDNHTATTTRKSDGNCTGLAYVRIKVQGSWGTWASSSSKAARTSPVYEIEASQHKDCNCSTANIKTLYP
ncbi:hypothetical protein [Streptomyces sp. NPDC004250]|uniref:hypothetical protein n=1 Tax=Streptomyces sp. NPDC004250 TaxID=3364692 RepID=UPI0036B8F0F9